MYKNNYLNDASIMRKNSICTKAMVLNGMILPLKGHLQCLETLLVVTFVLEYNWHFVGRAQGCC